MSKVTGAVALVLLIAATAFVAAARSATPAARPAPGGAATASAPASRPAGTFIWRSDIHDAENGDAGGAPAVTIVAARRGQFSGKIVISSDKAVRGLKVSVGDLKQQGAAAIPASAIRIRYGTVWDKPVGGGIIGGQMPPGDADILLESPRDEFAPVDGEARVPVWITVDVPEGAAPGKYTGKLTVSAAGLAQTDVPATLTVQDWTLPDPQDYRTWIDIIESPDTLAVEYGLPLWSQNHWEYVARSFARIRSTGSRVVYVPLICRTNLGNEESMVRWIRKEPNRYEYDFTIFD